MSGVEDRRGKSWDTEGWKIGKKKKAEWWGVTEKWHYWDNYRFFSFQQNQSVVTTVCLTPSVNSHLTCELFLECCYRLRASPAPPSPLSLSVDCWRSWPTHPRWSDLQHTGTRVKKNTHIKQQPWVTVCSNYTLWRTRLWHGVCYVGRCGAITRPGGAGRCSAGGVLWTATVYFTHGHWREVSFILWAKTRLKKTKHSPLAALLSQRAVWRAATAN